MCPDRRSRPPSRSGIVLLAYELARMYQGETSLTARWPWLVAFSYGLLHGFGFTGALSGIGLTRGDIPLALFTFNLGVEAGPLMFIATLLDTLVIARRLATHHGQSPSRWGLSTALASLQPSGSLSG